MRRIDLMSDSLSLSDYERQKALEGFEQEQVTAIKYWVLVRSMLLGARDKPKQTILYFRLAKFFKELALEFPPNFKAQKELAAELE